MGLTAYEKEPENILRLFHESPEVTHDPIGSYDLGSCFRICPFMLMSCTGSSEAATMRSVLAASLMSPDPTIVGKLLHIENLGGWRIANTAPFLCECLTSICSLRMPHLSNMMHAARLF